MFVPYFVGIVHDLLEWVDAPTYGSWTLGGLGSVSGAPALPPAPPAPPSPYPPPFPPTSSWFLGIKPLKPILKPDPDTPVVVAPSSVRAWNSVFKTSATLGYLEGSALSETALVDTAEDEIGGLKRKSLERTKEYCIDKESKRSRRLQVRTIKVEDPFALRTIKVEEAAKAEEDARNVKIVDFKAVEALEAVEVEEDLFKDLAIDEAGFEKILDLPKYMKAELDKEEYEAFAAIRQQIFEDRFFEENEYGKKESILLQKELNVTLDAMKYQDFAPEEMISIYGAADKDLTVNLLAFSMKPPTAIFGLEQAKQDIVRESYHLALEAERLEREKAMIYKPPPPPPAVVEVSAAEVEERLIKAGFSASELAKRTEGGKITLCEETELPPDQTDALTTVLTPPPPRELTKALEDQFGPREGFELFDPTSSGIGYPFRECKFEHGCFGDSDYEAQVEFLAAQDEDLDALKNEADFGFDAPIKSMNNLKKYLDVAFADSPVESVMKILGTPACFSRTTTACRLLQPATAGDAFAACFGSGLEAVAERVPMGALVAGDAVLADGAGLTRVVVNQHAGVKAAAPMLTLHFEGGSLSLTADHVLLLDGALSPARLAAVGSVLSSGRKVSAVTHGSQGVVNPITAAGTILAAGPSGEPVVAATANEWLADVLLSAYPKYTPSFNLAVLFPASVQACVVRGCTGDEPSREYITASSKWRAKSRILSR